jgi:hypothetical protein
MVTAICVVWERSQFQRPKENLPKLSHDAAIGQACLFVDRRRPQLLI